MIHFYKFFEIERLSSAKLMFMDYDTSKITLRKSTVIYVQFWSFDIRFVFKNLARLIQHLMHFLCAF